MCSSRFGRSAARLSCRCSSPPRSRRVLLGWEGGKNPNWRTIVGLYGDVRHGGLDTDKNPQRMELAVPIAQLPFNVGELGLG